MKRKISLKWIFLLSIAALVLSLSIYSKHQLYKSYTGKSLTIAVIGDFPEIKEEQVIFEEIAFDEVTNNDFDSYDAVFIMPEKLSQASENQYAKIYSTSAIPFFFIGADNHIPFIEVGLDFDDDSWENWKWVPGTSYACGYQSDSENSSTAWGFHLPNDTKTDNNIKAVYTEIFKSIADL